jgi:N-acetylglutamate synthase-like GNAT family acetyltransferase
VTFERRKNGALLTTDPSRIDVDAVERFLRASYWAAKRSRERIERSITHSLCFALIEERSGATFGFTRVVTDCADFAWLCDVWVEAEYRGRGFADWLIASVVEHPDLQGLRRIILATSNAHGLYARHGFSVFSSPELWMERLAESP